MTDDQNAVQQVEDALARVSKGFATRDVDLTNASYYQSDEFVLFDVMPPFFDAGWNTLAKKNDDFIRLTEGPTLLSWTDKHIEVSGSLAYFRGIAHFTAKYTDGRPMEGMFRHTLIFRNIGGKWMIVHEHSSQPNAAIDMHQEEAA